MSVTFNSPKGSIVALATPMLGPTSPYTAIDEDSIKGLVDFHVKNQTSAIVVVGTTGESATLTSEEHCNMISKVVIERTMKHLEITIHTARPGTIMFEAGGVTTEVAKEALRLAAQKLPVRTKFVTRRDYVE